MTSAMYLIELMAYDMTTKRNYQLLVNIEHIQAIYKAPLYSYDYTIISLLSREHYVKQPIGEVLNLINKVKAVVIGNTYLENRLQGSTREEIDE